MEKTTHPTDHARGRRCEDCDFAGVSGIKILCCYEPPKLFLVPLQTAQGVVPQIMRANPEMNPDDWCSKFIPLQPTH